MLLWVQDVSCAHRPTNRVDVIHFTFHHKMAYGHLSCSTSQASEKVHWYFYMLTSRLVTCSGPSSVATKRMMTCDTAKWSSGRFSTLTILPHYHFVVRQIGCDPLHALKSAHRESKVFSSVGNYWPEPVIFHWIVQRLNNSHLCNLHLAQFKRLSIICSQDVWQSEELIVCRRYLDMFWVLQLQSKTWLQVLPALPGSSHNSKCKPAPERFGKAAGMIMPMAYFPHSLFILV